MASSYPAIIRLDSVTGEMTYITDWVPVVAGMTSDEGSFFFADKLVVQDNSFVVASCCSNAVVCFNMDTLTSTVYSVGNKSNRHSAICFDGVDYWLSPRSDGPVIKWNMSTDQWEEYGDYPSGYSAAPFGFWSIIYADRYVWSFLSMRICALGDVATGEMNVAEILGACLHGNRGPGKY